jgi:hypothetical protein
MANEFGFVYLLSNEAMPDIYKIGFSDRSPHQRALELSASTSCPVPFSVVCYVEVQSPVSVERWFHESFKELRVNQSREFFRLNEKELSQVVRTFIHLPQILAFTSCAGWFDAVCKCSDFHPDREDEFMAASPFSEDQEDFGQALAKVEEVI